MTPAYLALLYGVCLIVAGAQGFRRLAYADAGAKYPLLHMAKYVLGTFLAVSVMLIIWLLSSAAQCAEGARTPEGNLEFGDNCAHTRNWYAVLTDWQSGVGALIGLLGLAWTTLLNALMEKSNKAEGS